MSLQTVFQPDCSDISSFFWNLIFLFRFCQPLRFFWLTFTTHCSSCKTHTHIQYIHTEAAKSSTQHADRNFTHSKSHKFSSEYSIPTATCCIPSPGGDSATQHHNQFHKNCGVRCHMKDSPLWLPCEREALTLRAMSKCQVKPLIYHLLALWLYPWVHLTQHFKWEWMHSFIFCVSLNVTFFP